MSHGLIGDVFGLAVICMILFAIVAYLRWQSRANAGLATSLGFEPGASGLTLEAGAFPMTLDGGVVARAEASAHGMWRGRRAESVWVGAGDQARMIAAFRIELVELPESLPRVEVIARDHFSLVPTGGGDVIDLESDEFNAAFHVLSPDRAYAHAVLHPRMMERLLLPDARGVSVTVSGRTVFCWRPSAGGSEGAAARLNLLSDVADLLPGFLEGRFPTEAGSGGAAVPLRSTDDGGAATSRNWCVWLAWGLAATLVLLPAGIVAAHVALRAARAGRASNDAAARMLLYLGYPALALVALGWVLASGGEVR